MQMKRETTVAIKVSENHRRSISITLQLIDQALCEWDDWTSGRLQSSIMYREIDTLSAIQKQQLNNKIANIRQLIVRLRDDLDLEPKNVATARSIATRASLLWEMLTELNSRGLSGYGTVPEELGRYLDPIGEQLAAEMDEITSLLSKPITVPIRS